ncbi:hypothetical protein HDV02_002084, partial [Globomyces sp. JEL0801]
MALTATATKTVQDDIIQQLELYDPKVFISSFNRANLHYDVWYKPPDNDPTPAVLKFLKSIYSKRKSRLDKDKTNERIEGVCGIIYCATRAETESITATLRKNHIRAKAYHAGFTPQTRKDILNAWTGTDELSSTNDGNDSHEVIDIVVATISFGMGIDKKSVRFVIHWDLPKSMEGYYQEAGRAGRDGNVSRCILCYSQQDVDRNMFLMKSGADHENNLQTLKSFETLVEYCKNTSICRHKFIVDYFTADMSPNDIQEENLCPEKRCDICRNPKKVLDMINAAKLNQVSLRSSQLEIPTTCTTLFSKEYNMAQQTNQNVRLRDGSIASFATNKRTYDEYSSMNESGGFFNSDSSYNPYPGFQSASRIHSDTVNGPEDGVKDKFSREFYTGKKGIRQYQIDTTTSTYPLQSTHKTIPGCTATIRDRFVTKLKKFITDKIDTLHLSNPIEVEDIENLAIEIEGAVFANNQLLVTYQNAMVSRLRKIKQF